MDRMSKKARSELMSRIRCKWTGPEKKLHSMLKACHVRHRMHPKIAGHPDALVEGHVAVFLNGCFWHSCPEHYRAPKSNKRFWRKKARRNAKNQAESIKALRSLGFRVRVIWEHDKLNAQEIRGLKSPLWNKKTKQIKKIK